MGQEFSEKSMQVSLEVFPPKKDGDFQSAFEVVKQLAELEPAYISVTYGAGGSRSKATLEITSYIQNELHIPAMAHLTCIGSKREDIQQMCEEFRAHNISHVLALRGDRPKDMSDEQYNNREFTYATDLVRFLSTQPELHISGACYPEKHFESFSKESDLLHMKEKQDAGARLFITQMFFDNDYFYDFRERAARKGITAPIHVGIMPLTSTRQISTTIALSGSSLPKALTDVIAAHGDRPDDMYRAGIDYAIRQIRDLKENGVDGVHIYAMNKPGIASEIMANI